MSTLSVPPMLVSKSSRGLRVETTMLRAAAWKTISFLPTRRSTRGASHTEPSTNSNPWAGRFSRRPVKRSSSTVTLAPSRSRRFTRLLPTKPAPPVTRTLRFSSVTSFLPWRQRTPKQQLVARVPFPVHQPLELEAVARVHVAEDLARGRVLVWEAAEPVAYVVHEVHPAAALTLAVEQGRERIPQREEPREHEVADVDRLEAAAHECRPARVRPLHAPPHLRAVGKTLDPVVDRDR